MIDILLLISWSIDSVLLVLSLRAARTLSGGRGSVKRRMIVSSIVLAGVLAASVIIVLVRQDRAARWAALCLVCWPAIAVTASLLYVLLLAMFVRDWR